MEPEAGGGEDRRTRRRKALPPWVFTILEPEKEKKGGGGASENGNGMGNEKERKKRALYFTGCKNLSGYEKAREMNRGKFRNLRKFHRL